VALTSPARRSPSGGPSLSDGVVTLSPLDLDDVEARLAGADDELVRWYLGGPGEGERTTAYVRRTGDPLKAWPRVRWLARVGSSRP
jgi:hypothetical protein